MKIVVSSGKRKTAIARATVREGKGQVYINKTPIENYLPLMARQIMEEPLLIASNDVTSKVDIRVNVRGGGIMGQAQASRIAIARGLVDFTKSADLRKQFVEYDRTLMAGDSRRKEKKKFGGPGARAKRQKSYR
ncbi:MAG: 30S ribosomal protein S9 [Candidatus Hermodarchaeota archaeon]|nr:30S ribosomal protein S9 [Candidatus Hermodarchaeota archaeon]